MKWFGRYLGVPAQRESEQVEVPIGEPCIACERLIEDTDDGYLIPFIAQIAAGPLQGKFFPIERVWHRACFLENILGPNWKDFDGGHDHQG